jgi:hypothetical protein
MNQQQADALALATFDELLALGAAARAQRLAELARADPALHGRLQAMLAGLDASDASLAVVAPLGAAWVTAANAGALPGPAAGDTVAGYRLQRELGRGGMSAVWLAERVDGQVKRPVAIKLPLAGRLLGVPAGRFARERDLLAALEHPHIARLYDAGTSDQGLPFIVLEFVDGTPITEHARTLGLGRDARITLFLQVLAAVDHAHRRLVVHRDLKPGNILVDGAGQVKLLDFGIAKLLLPDADAPALTQDLSAVMTPRYAAPEQISGAPVTTATDVYAAGVVLYELLTGRLPYAAAGATLSQTVQAVLHTAPAPPGLGPQLDAVLAKALAKSPDERYASAERLADDLRRVLAHRPVAARRAPLAQRLRLWLQRHRRPALAGGVALLALAGAGTLAWSRHQASLEQEARADAVRDFIFRAMSDAEPQEGQTSVSAQQLVDGAVQRARQDFDPQPRLQGELLAELGRVQFRLQAVDASARTLGEAVALLDRHAPLGDPARHRAQAHLARALLLSDGKAAQALAQQALAGCTSAGVWCVQARALAHYALAALGSYQGRNADALAHARAMRDEAFRMPTDEALERIAALETLAGTARNAGQWAEGAAAVSQAQALAASQVLRAANRERLDLLQALLDHDLGRYTQAAAALQALAASAPNAQERALRLRMASNAEVAGGQASAAVASAQRAAQELQSLGAQAQAADGAFVQQALARALAAQGQHPQAGQALARADTLMQSAGFAPGGQARLRLRRLAGELAVRRGDNASAQTLLLAVQQAEAAAATPASERALTLEWLGCALAGQGQQMQTQTQAQAQALHQQADGLLAPLLAADHPRRQRLARSRQDPSSVCSSG